MNKKNLLIVSAIAPLPMTSGGATRIYHEIKELSRYFNVYLITYVDNDLTKAEKTELKKYVKESWIIYKKSKSWLSFLTHFIPYWFSDYNIKEVDHILFNVLKQYQIDIVQVEFPQLLHFISYLKPYKNMKKIYGAIDIAYVSFWRRLLTAKINLLKKFIYFARFIEILFYELFYLSKYDLVLTMSEKDKEIIKFLNVKTVVVPNGIEKVDFIKKTKLNTFGYIGSFSHPPNREAIHRLVLDIFPKLYEKNKKSKLYIFGVNKTRDLEDLKWQIEPKYSKSIKFIGYVKNLKNIYEIIDILVAPILSGSGTRLKILEALSFGIPVVTTAIGAEGLSNENLPLLFIESNDKKIIKRALSLIKDNKNHYYKYELENKLSVILDKFLWQKIFFNYYKTLQSLY